MKLPIELVHIISKSFDNYLDIIRLFKTNGYKISIKFTFYHYFQYISVPIPRVILKYKTPILIWSKNNVKHNRIGPVIGCYIKQRKWFFYNSYNKHEEWCLNGKFHRDNDLPAIIWPNGTKEWYQNDNLHRDNGPAIIRADGSQEWWINGKNHRIDGPAYIDGLTEKWYKNGKLHRENGPAVIDRNGSELWYFKGKLHRKNGPAIKNKDGSEMWFINGELRNPDGHSILYAGGKNGLYDSFPDGHKCIGCSLQ